MNLIIIIGGIVFIVVVICGIVYLIRKKPTLSFPVSDPLRQGVNHDKTYSESDAQTCEKYLKPNKIENIDDKNPASVDQFMGMPYQLQAKYIRFFAPKPNPATDLTPEMLEKVHFAGDDCLICFGRPTQIVYLPCMHALACCDCDFRVIAMQLSTQLESDGKLPKTTLLSKEFVRRWLENHFSCFLCKRAVKKRVELPKKHVGTVIKAPY